MRKCGKCAAKSVPSPDTAEKMAADVRKMRGVKLVSDDEYDRRLKICGGCEKFEYGSTCLLCGCVMQVRAMLRSGHCPYPNGGKW